MPTWNGIVELTVLEVNKKRGKIKILANEWEIIFLYKGGRLKKLLSRREGVRENGGKGYVPSYIFNAALRYAWAVLKEKEQK